MTDDLMKLVRTYRVTAGLSERLRLAEEIFRQVEPGLRLFVYNAVRAPAADDVLQEVLKAVATSLTKFAGDTHTKFWAWSYGIARNKINDQYRRQATDRMEPMPEKELRQLVEASAHAAPLSAADKHDLDYAMNLLAAAKPECRDFLWQHYVLGLDYAEIADEQKLSYDNVRMKIGRCLEQAKSLVS